jgi:hypothetical protein
MQKGEKMKRIGNIKMIPTGGMAGWLLNRLRTGVHERPKMALLERIALAPHQSLALVEAEGLRFLVATSSEGAPAFYALDEHPQSTRKYAKRQSDTARPTVRVSW